MENHGFSLLELLICCAIVMLLSTVALPSYQQHQRNQQQNQAQIQLVNLQLQQQAYRLENLRYAPLDALRLPENPNYVFGVEFVDNQRYVLTATLIDPMRQGERCASLSLTQSLNKYPAECWR